MDVDALRSDSCCVGFCLKFSNVGLSDRTVEVLAAILPSLSNLETIDLEVLSLVKQTYPPPLTMRFCVVCVQNNLITHFGARHLSRVLLICSLCLCVASCWLVLFSFNLLLQAIATFSHVRELCFNYNKIGDEGTPLCFLFLSPVLSLPPPSRCVHMCL